jgi:malonyl-CoA/methylmalonyl-CoA synthetase
VADEPWARHLPFGAAWHDGSASEGGTLPAVWRGCWEAAPDRPVLALVGAAAGEAGGGPAEPDGRWVTAGELDGRTRTAAGRLAAAGLAPGERLVWPATSSLASVVACLAALRLGAVVVPVHPAATARELGRVVAEVRPTVALVDHDLEVLDAPGGPLPPALDRAAATDPALIVYTSGTSGRPKGAVLSHGNLLAGANALRVAWRWSPEDRLVLALPLFHVHGLCAGLFGTLCAGGSAVVLARFDPGAVLDAVDRHRATLFFGVPTMYHRLLGVAGVAGLSRLRLCVSGSAPLPAATWERIRSATGVAVLERYGMTETLLTVSNPYEGERRPGTVGFPLPGVEIRVGDADHDEGQLLVRGPSIFSEYWERPAASADCFAEGWFRTGDLAEVDADGYVTILGRRDDLIISGGHNVYPSEVEEVLLAHPGVAEVAVTGSPSEEWGESVTAWVVLSDRRLSSGDLLAHAAEQLAPSKRPRLVRFVDALPRNAMGKVQRSELR